MRKRIIQIIVSLILASTLLPITEVASEKLNERHLMFLLNTRQYYENGSVYLAQAPHEVISGVTFVSMRSLAERLDFEVVYLAETKEYVMRNDSDELAFSFDEGIFYHNGEGKVFRSGKSHVVNGSLMIPLRETVTALGISITPEMSTNKVHLRWTEESKDPSLEKPEEPFEVNITAEKSNYKIGEKIEYQAKFSGKGSTDVQTNWVNNQPAFFTAGPQTIVLEATNRDGEVITTTHTVMISDEIEYTEEQFNAKYTNYGDIISIDGADVLNYDIIEAGRTDLDDTLVLSNSPEKINQEGFYYDDVLSGDIRFMIHHQNDRRTPVKLYLLAKNESSDEAKVTVERTVVAGPSMNVASQGKNSVANYFRSFNNQTEEVVSIRPNGHKLIATELSDEVLSPDQVITMYADVHTDKDVRFQVVVLEEQNDLSATLPFLPGITASRGISHNRGTFADGSRELRVEERIGDDRKRLVIGDGQTDEYITGFDSLTGKSEINYGNWGVLYNIVLEEVAPNTAIVVNPRGGRYAGAFTVNGEVIMAPTIGTLQSSSEALVLYRTGDEAESIDIGFTPSSGSNLPLNIVTIPMENDDGSESERDD